MTGKKRKSFRDLPPNRVRELRGKMSLDELAKRTGISKNSLHLIETQGAEVTLSKLRMIAHALGVRTSALLVAEDVEYRPGPELAELLKILEPFSPEERLFLTQAAQGIIALVQRLAGQERNAGLEGSSIEIAQLTDIWNTLSDVDRQRALALLQIGMPQSGAKNNRAAISAAA
jgi:transcriptional regulator with XRE-family HTH domain